MMHSDCGKSIPGERRTTLLPYTGLSSMIHKAIMLVCACTVAALLPHQLYAQVEYSELDKCRALIDEGRLEEAKKALTEFRRSHPDNPRALFYLAELDEDFDRARALYREVEILAVHPDLTEPDSTLAAEAVFARAELLLSGGNHETAKGLYEHLITRYQRSGFFSDAVYRLGTMNLVSGESEKALEKFRTCLEMDSAGPKRALYASGKMECYVALEDWTQALHAAREVLDESDEDSAVTPRVLQVIARAWHELGNEENTAIFNERLLNNYPDSFQAHAIRENGNRIASDLGYSLDPGGAVIDSVDSDVSHSPVLPSEDEAVVSVGEPESEKTPEFVEEDVAVYSIQASAFKNRMNALKMYNSLKGAGFDARIEMKTVLDQHLYIVRVGYYRTRDEAETVRGRVTGVTREKANVVILE